jgi:hypothetical protein
MSAGFATSWNVSDSAGLQQVPSGWPVFLYHGVMHEALHERVIPNAQERPNCGKLVRAAAAE